MRELGAAPGGVRAVSCGELLGMDIPPRSVLLSPWLTAQSLSMIVAARGVGKTHCALGIAYALAAGGEFLGWKAPRPVRVLYVDGEMPAGTIQERLKEIFDKAEVSPDNLRIVTPDLQEPRGAMPDLATADGRRMLDAEARWAEVIVIDNLSCLVRNARENEGDDWVALQTWVLQLRAEGRSVVLVHHEGRSGQPRGTSRREDVLDIVIALKHPDGYVATEGARFEIHFTKSRALSGEDVAPREAWLTDRVWQVKPVLAGLGAQIAELVGNGMNQAAVARQLGVDKSTVSRHCTGSRRG